MQIAFLYLDAKKQFLAQFSNQKMQILFEPASKIFPVCAQLLPARGDLVQNAPRYTVNRFKFNSFGWG